MFTPSRSVQNTSVVLALLFAGAFIMGCSEELVFGMLDLIATGLEVSVPATGQLVTANALGLMVGGPLLTLLTTRVDRRAVLLVVTAAFVLLNLAPVLVDSYWLILVSRALVGAAQGVFIAAAITMATRLAPPERAGRAMAVVISGFATASAFGLPLFTLLGRALGWRSSFGAVVVTGLVVLLAAVVVLPSIPTAEQRQSVGGQLRHALAPRVLAVLGLCVLVFAGVQAAWTYLVPFLGEVTGDHRRRRDGLPAALRGDGVDRFDRRWPARRRGRGAHPGRRNDRPERVAARACTSSVRARWSWR